MALTLPYPDMDFVPLDILTAAEQDQLVANIEYIANQFPVATANIADEAVNANKIDFATFNAASATSSQITVNTTETFVTSVTVPSTGKYLVTFTARAFGSTSTKLDATIKKGATELQKNAINCTADDSNTWRISTTAQTVEDLVSGDIMNSYIALFDGTGTVRAGACLSLIRLA